MLRLTVSELAEGGADAPLLDIDGAPVDPLVLVDLREQGLTAGAAAAARRTPRIVVGVGDVAAPLDLALLTTVGPRTTVTVDDLDAATEVVAAAVESNPRAALVLVRLLRWSGCLATPDALDAESLAYSTLLGGPEFARWLANRGPQLPPPAVTDPVLVERTTDELRITLNRPERRNAYGRQVRDALVDALQIAELDPDVRSVVLDGAGPSFCAGGDLAEFGSTPDPVTAHLVRTHAGAGLLLDRLADRIEVHVHGTCVGAGVELPALAGRVLARPGTTFRLPELAMGLIPGAGGTVGIPRRIGRWRTLWLALTGVTLDTDRAVEWGLADAVA